MSKNNLGVITAYEKGYRVVKGQPVSPNGVIRKCNKEKKGLRFGIRMPDNTRRNVTVARLAGYQKFKEKIFDPELFVYHKDGDKNNNELDNILLGTYSEAQMSKPVAVRLNAAMIGTQSVKKHDHESIIAMHNSGLSYKQIKEITGIKSNGVISYICKKSIQSK